MPPEAASAHRLLFLDLSATRLTPDERELLASRRFAGLCIFARNVQDRYQLADYLTEVRSLAGEDFIVAADQEGGRVLRVLDIPYPPPAMALGAANDPELTLQVAAAAARGLLSVGINVDFAPVADVNVNPLNPVIAERSFSADPRQVSRQVVAFIEGLQGAGVAATVKHFPGHGDTAVDSHLALQALDRSLEELERLELPPFRSAVEAGVAGVMTAHILFPRLDKELPATLSPKVIPQLLRERLGFDGVVFSDALDMKAVSDHHTPLQANLLALRAGVDAPLNIGDVAHHLAIAGGIDAAVKAGELDPAALAASVRRLDTLRARFPAGTPNPAAAWAEGDAGLLARAAREGLAQLGDLPRLDPAEPVTVVYQVRTVAHDATQQIVTPGQDFAALLRESGYRVLALEYQPDSLDAADLLARVPGGQTVIYSSSGRAQLPAAEVEFVKELADMHHGRYLHLSLWNPYHALALPQPALVAFGFRPAQLQAALAALTGTPVTGVLPLTGMH